MSQDWTTNLYTTATEADTTLTNMELMFSTLKCAFSGATAPASQVPGQIWFDTTKKACKQRNQGDTAWVGLMHGDTSQKIWVYRNAAMDGWAVDSGVSDKVLAIKGGTTYTTGAETAGSWTVSGLAHTHSHNHKWYDVDPAGAHDTWDTDGNPTAITKNTQANDAIVANSDEVQKLATESYTDLDATSGGTQDGTWRAAAAVGTLQYLDL